MNIVELTLIDEHLRGEHEGCIDRVIYIPDECKSYHCPECKNKIKK